MFNGKIIIATTTFTKDPQKDIRASLALKTIEEAKKFRFPIVVVDGSPAPEFKQMLQDTGAIVYDETEPGMGKSRRQAVAEAVKLMDDGGVVVWMEPEKWPLVQDLSFLSKFVLDGDADLIIPRRSEDGLRSYPLEQILCEQYGNEMFKIATGRDHDVWFGPRIMNRTAVQYFLDYQDEYGGKWDSIFTFILRMVATGRHAVMGVVSEHYIHPTEQTTAEKRDLNMAVKRLEQLQNLVPMIRDEAIKLGLYPH